MAWWPLLALVDRGAEALDRAVTARGERRLWANARTLADAGHLVALWAVGRMRYTPGGYDQGPAEETASIAWDLFTLNEGGFVTYGSQPGEWVHHTHASAELLEPARAFAQRAAVDGVAEPDLAERLMVRARAAGMIVHVGPAHTERLPWDHPRSTIMTVYTDAEHVPDDPASVETPPPGAAWMCESRAGAATKRDLYDCFEGIGADGWDAVEAATMLTIVDPVWGRERELWSVLAAAVREHHEGIQVVGRVQ